jgi:uncharacterized phage protein (TIGR02218 family)
MKQIPMALLDVLLSIDVESTYIADLFTITLPSGLVMRATDGQLPVTYGANQFLPTRWGSWRCEGTKCGLGPMNAEANFEVLANDEELLPQWNCSVNEAAQLGLFDAATILIQTAYMPDVWGDTALGVVTRFGGQISAFTPVGRTTIKGKAGPYTFTFNQPMPRKVLQPQCGWTLGDAGCTVNLASFTFANAVASGSNNIYVTPAVAFTQADGYFTQGVIKMTSGQNSGIAVQIQDHSGGILRLVKPFLFPVNIGDTFEVIAGCDHTVQSCQQKFSNTVLGSIPNHYGGMPFIPNRETFL